MFSPGTKKPNFRSSQKDRHLGQAAPQSPVTPFLENRKTLPDTSIPNRPSTGTPAPWSSRLSLLARTSAAKKLEKGNGAESIQPVYVGDFPQAFREEQTSMLQKHVPSSASVSGGMDRETSLSWIICGSRLFVWNYLSPAASRNCIILELPPHVLGSEYLSKHRDHGGDWLLSVVNWDQRFNDENKFKQQCSSAGVILCNKRSQALIYWPDVYVKGGSSSILSLPEDFNLTSLSNKSNSPNKEQEYSTQSRGLFGSCFFSSLIASAIPDVSKTCVALACSSNGELWQFHCSPIEILRNKVYHESLSPSSQVNYSGQHLGMNYYPRSLVWRFLTFLPEGLSGRQFFILTDHEVQCFVIRFDQDLCVSKLWCYEIIGTDGDLGIKKDLAGQKQIWPLDLQVGENGKSLTVLIATYCKDRISSSSFTQYSLLTLHYKPGLHVTPEASDLVTDKVLERKTPVQIIIPKARIEEESFLFSMKLRVGGKPSGSVIIISGDGTAIVSHCWRNSTRIYQFDLPNDAGKVLDASVFPATVDGEDGDWVVLTEKAGIWAIPEEAVVIGGVEPHERRFTQKLSSDERPNHETSTFPERITSESRDTGDRQRTEITWKRTAQDEESEALLGHLFHDFLSSGQVDASLEKLRNAGAFDKDDEINVFARASKSIVDTLAKHWTSTRGVEIVATAVVTTQLMDKQQKHQKFLQFLALSKCHEVLHSGQRRALQIIMEHGEKLAGMIKLRELQNSINERRSTELHSIYSNSGTETSGSIWDLIQLVGDRARRSTVLLMDRDNAEVFYSKVSDLEEVFYCLERYVEYLISTEQPIAFQMRRACELSNACVTLVRSAMEYKNEYHVWYPSSEGLTPWYCKHVVRGGLWSTASFILQLLNESTGLDLPALSDIYNHFEVLVEVLLEAYAGAISAKAETEESRSLQDEYMQRRDALLECLYQQIIALAKSGPKDFNNGEKEQSEMVFKELSSRLISIAKRHGGYQTLWRICCDINDLGLLRNLMQESMGSRGSFIYFVFGKLFETKQFPKLLRLGEEFHEELCTFLKWHPELLWLHQVYLQQFPSASESLHLLALSHSSGSVSEAVDGKNPQSDILKITLSERRHLLNLSKIAAMAGKYAAQEGTMQRIEADLKILQLQAEIAALVPEDEQKENIEHQLLPPRDLIELCLNSQNPGLVLHAFDVFAWTSSSFIRNNKILLEECWKTAADLDDWGRLYEASLHEGWSDEDSLRILRETVLFQASRRCYGAEAETFEGGFDEVLPLRQEDTDGSILKDSGSSVEAVLMLHKDFGIAGKLMLTAIMLGAAQIDIGGDVEVISPME